MVSPWCLVRSRKLIWLWSENFFQEYSLDDAVVCVCVCVCIEKGVILISMWKSTYNIFLIHCIRVWCCIFCITPGGTWCLIVPLLVILSLIGGLWWCLDWEDPPGEGKGYPLQYSGLENSMDCIVHGVAKSDTTEQLSLVVLPSTTINSPYRSFI